MQLLFTDTRKQRDNMYGMYLSKDKFMIGDSKFDVNDKDDVILNNTIVYKGTAGVYEVVFKRIPEDEIYTS